MPSSGASLLRCWVSWRHRWAGWASRCGRPGRDNDVALGEAGGGVLCSGSEHGDPVEGDRAVGVAVVCLDAVVHPDVEAGVGLAAVLALAQGGRVGQVAFDDDVAAHSGAASWVVNRGCWV